MPGWLEESLAKKWDCIYPDMDLYFLHLYLRLHLYLYLRDAQMAGRVNSKIFGLDFSISGNCIVYDSVYYSIV